MELSIPTEIKPAPRKKGSFLKGDQLKLESFSRKQKMAI
jgi:hypothetical protein